MHPGWPEMAECDRPKTKFTKQTQFAGLSGPDWLRGVPGAQNPRNRLPYTATVKHCLSVKSKHGQASLVRGTLAVLRMTKLCEAAM